MTFVLPIRDVETSSRGLTSPRPVALLVVKRASDHYHNINERVQYPLEPHI
jgi:hypothetical protein